MAHDKVFGFCESKCKVEVPSLEQQNIFSMIHTCSTSETDVSKIIDIPSFSLKKDVYIQVIFINGNDVANPTININDTGAKEIRVYRNQQTLPLSKIYGANQSGAYKWDKGVVLQLRYDGTYWIVVGNPIVKQKISDYRGGAPIDQHKVYIDGYKEIYGFNSGSSELDLGIQFEYTENINGDVEIHLYGGLLIMPYNENFTINTISHKVPSNPYEETHTIIKTNTSNEFFYEVKGYELYIY